MLRLADRIALVTGGADGIGRATSLALAGEGAHVFVTDVDPSGGGKTCAAIAAAGGQATFVRADVTLEADWAAALAAVRSGPGRLDILVNNAGICIMKPLADFSLADWRRLTAINLDGVFLGTRMALPLLAEGRGGAIVNMASAAGRTAAPLMAAYCASKAAVIMFTRAMALECAQLKLPVRINAVCPGGVATSLWVKLTNDGRLPACGVTEAEMAEKRGWTEAITPIGFAGDVADVASGVVYLVSDDARFVTGTELVIDGGNSAGQTPHAY